MLGLLPLGLAAFMLFPSQGRSNPKGNAQDLSCSGGTAFTTEKIHRSERDDVGIYLDADDCLMLVDEADPTRMQAYCKHFGLQLGVFKDDFFKIHYCYEADPHIPVCSFTSEFHSNLWDYLDTEPSKTAHQDKAEIYKLIKAAVSKAENNGADPAWGYKFDNVKLIRILGETHPINQWIREIPESKHLYGHYFISEKGGVGLTQGTHAYYSFINTTTPFKELVNALPTFLSEASFWKAMSKAYVVYVEHLTEHERYNAKKLEDQLRPVREMIHKHFKHTPYLLYPIHTRVNSSVAGSKARLMLYYEEQVAGSWWGRSVIIPVIEVREGDTPFIIQGNYELETNAPRSFLYEEYLSLGEGKSAVKRNRVKSGESCLSCHLEINKPKTGLLQDHPAEERGYYSDFMDALALSHRFIGGGSSKLNDFRYKGESHNFPYALSGIDASSGQRKTLELFDAKHLGPILGSQATPLANECFKDYGANEKDVNCFKCHNGQAGIHMLNFKMAMESLESSSMYADTAYRTRTHLKLAKEMFMPYGLVPLKREHASVSKAALVRLQKCLSKNFQEDYFNWIKSSLLPLSPSIQQGAGNRD